MNKNQYTNERAWSNYWTTGYQSTFTGHEDSGFFIELAEYWKAQFSALDNGARIVDLGCGNGSVSAIAAGCSDKGLDVIAVDYAAVERSSSVFKQYPNIEIRDQTKIEKTGIDDSSVDLCVSQFGFEYADRIGAATEAHRILKSGGKLIAVVHHRQSQISQSCASAHMQIGLCYRSKLTDISRKLIKRLRKLEKSHRDTVSDETAKATSVEFNKVAGAVYDHGSRLPDMEHVKYFLNELSSLFSEKAKGLSFTEKMAIIDAVDENARNYQLRMEAMLKASLDEANVKDLEQSLRDTGLNIDEVSIMDHDQQIFAWRVIASK
jgi:ubiquinone/menaquinone biosynthesis C-methylase UbiE